MHGATPPRFKENLKTYLGRRILESSDWRIECCAPEEKRSRRRTVARSDPKTESISGKCDRFTKPSETSITSEKRYRGHSGMQKSLPVVHQVLSHPLKFHRLLDDLVTVVQKAESRIGTLCIVLLKQSYTLFYRFSFLFNF